MSIIIDLGIAAVTTVTFAATGYVIAQAETVGIVEMVTQHGFTLVFAATCLGLGVLGVKMFAKWFLDEHNRIVDKLTASEHASEQKDQRLLDLLQTTIKENTDEKANLAAALNRFCESRPCLLEDDSRRAPKIG